MRDKIFVGLTFLFSAVVLVAGFNNCSTKRSEESTNTTAGAEPTPTPRKCMYRANALAKATNFNFDPSSSDQCNGFDGTTSRWTGMTGSVAYVAPNTTLFAGGAACGQCVRITGAAATVVGRVSTSCPDCAADTIDMDAAAFAVVTGSSAAGVENVSVELIECPLTQNISFHLNSGSNAYYLSLSAANYKHPIVSIQIGDPVAGWQAMTRIGGTNAFQYNTSAPDGFGATVAVKAMDTFGQLVQATISTSAATATSVQFGNCH